MSFNSNGLIPQFVSQSGQLYYIANPSYLIPRPYSEGQHALPSQPIQHQLPPAQPRQIEIQPLPQPRVQSVKAQPPSLTKEQTNAKVRNIKEKCISHYIDGQLIIETSKPLTEKKSKKKKLHVQNKQERQQQQQQHQQKQQQQSHPQQQQQIQQQQPRQQPQSHPLPAPPSQLQQPPQHHHKPSQQQQQQQQQHHQPAPLPPQEAQQQMSQSQPAQTLSLAEVMKVRAQMATMDCQQVAEFIERHEEIKECAAKFAEDEIDGMALLFMIDRNLDFQKSNVVTSMFKLGPAMKIEATLSKYQIPDNK